MQKYLFRNLSDKEGQHFIYRFENGYGASVIKNQYSYGGNVGLWEVACIYFYEDEECKYEIAYPFEFDNVVGFLTWEKVEEQLKIIKNIKVY